MFAELDNKAKTEESLPLDVRTLLIGIWAKRLVLLVAIPLAIILGAGVGLALGRQTFESHVLVLYRPVSPTDQADPAARLQTRRDIVKVNDNLEEVRNRLNLDVSLDQLGSLYEVVVPKQSTLMTISAKWNNSETASQLANTLANVFIEAQLRLSSTESASDEYSRLEEQQQDVANRLAAVNLQIASLNSMDMAYRSHTGGNPNDAKALKDISAVTRRIERIRQAIADEKDSRVNAATLAQLESEVRMAQKMYEVGAISHQEMEKSVTAYRKQEAVTKDTNQTAQWKKELAKLQMIAAPSAASPMAQEMAAKSVDLQLEAINLQSTMRKTQIEMERLKQKIATRQSDRGRSYDQTDTQPRGRNSQVTERSDQEQTPDYWIVSRAKANLKPVSSTRKVLALATTVVALALTALAILGLVLLDPTIKASAEGRIKLRLPVWRELPLITKGFLSGTRVLADPQSGILARYLAQTVQREPARYLVTSAGHRAGVTTVTLNLAAAYARFGKRVVVVTSHPILSDAPPAKLQELERYIQGSSQEVAAGILPHDGLGIDCLVCGNPEEYPHLLSMPRVRQMLDGLAELYDVVLVDAPPILPYGDAEHLVQWVDAVVIVVGSKSERTAAIRKAIDRIQVMRPEHFGIVLNRVAPPYLES